MPPGVTKAEKDALRRDLLDAIARLQQIPRVLAEVTAVMRLGMQDRMMQPRYLLEKVAEEAQGIAASAPEKSPFAEPLANSPIPSTGNYRWTMLTAAS